MFTLHIQYTWACQAIHSKDNSKHRHKVRGVFIFKSVSNVQKKVKKLTKTNTLKLQNPPNPIPPSQNGKVVPLKKPQIFVRSLDVSNSASKKSLINGHVFRKVLP